MLTMASDDKQRGQIAREILERIIPALDAEYDRIREEEAMEPGEFDRKTKRIKESIRIRLIQIRKELQTARGRRKLELQKMLEIKQAEYDNINAS
jgi:hypothetical protein